MTVSVTSTGVIPTPTAYNHVVSTPLVRTDHIAGVSVVRRYLCQIWQREIAHLGELVEITASGDRYICKRAEKRTVVHYKVPEKAAIRSNRGNGHLIGLVAGLAVEESAVVVTVRATRIASSLSEHSAGSSWAGPIAGTGARSGVDERTPSA